MRNAEPVLTIIRERGTHAEGKPSLCVISVTRPSMPDGPQDRKYRIERLESCMLGNGHVQFGGGPMEQGSFCTSPAAYPTRP